MWLVVAGRGHSSEQRGLTEDLDDAKANVNEHAELLRREGRTDWFGFVLDLDRPTVIAPPGSTNRCSGGSACTSSTGATERDLRRTLIDWTPRSAERRESRYQSSG